MLNSVNRARAELITPYRTADPYSRLRVPKYRKAFEAAFFVSFLALYYAVLLEKTTTGIGIFEMLMYLWIAAFAYDEFSGMTDAGVAFYQMDFWKIWNMGIIGTGLAFVITSESFNPLSSSRFCLASVQCLASAECVPSVPSGGPSWIHAH